MEYYVTVRHLNLRTTPVTTDASNIITTLIFEDVVDVSDTTDPKFYKVSITKGGQLLQGYAAAQYLAAGTPASKPGVKYLEPVNLQPNAASRRDVHDNFQYPLGEAGMPKVDPNATPDDRIAAMHQIIAYLQVAQSARYTPGDHTYCNIYAYDYCYLTGVFLPRVWWTSKSLIALKAGDTIEPKDGKNCYELTANAIFAWLEEWGAEYNWVRTYDLTELQSKVNEGRVGVISAANVNSSRSGHICCVIPENAAHKATSTGTVVTCPLLSQSGRRNIPYYNNNRWWINLAQEFKGVGYWYCNYPAAQ